MLLGAFVCKHWPVCIPTLVRHKTIIPYHDDSFTSLDEWSTWNIHHALVTGSLCSLICPSGLLFNNLHTNAHHRKPHLMKTNQAFRGTLKTWAQGSLTGNHKKLVNQTSLPLVVESAGIIKSVLSATVIIINVFLCLSISGFHKLIAWENPLPLISHLVINA